MDGGDVGEGYAYASGSVSNGANGQAVADVEESAEDDYSYANGYANGYSAYLEFSVDAGDNDEFTGRTQFTAKAVVWAHSESYGSVSVTSGIGQIGVNSSADCSGSVSVSVSW